MPGWRKRFQKRDGQPWNNALLKAAISLHPRQDPPTHRYRLRTEGNRCHIPWLKLSLIRHLEMVPRLVAGRIPISSAVEESRDSFEMVNKMVNKGGAECFERRESFRSSTSRRISRNRISPASGTCRFRPVPGCRPRPSRKPYPAAARS